MVEALSREKLVFATLSAPTEWDAPDAKWMVRVTTKELSAHLSE
jgi:hypothetical protein